MTRLTDLMQQGFQIQISEMVTPGTVFPHYDPGTERTTLVFHPFDYSYVSNDDIFVAHEINMLRIYKNIEDSYQRALKRLDDMIYEMEHKHDPKVMAFIPNVEVVELEDGTYEFRATLGDTPFKAEKYMSDDEWSRYSEVPRVQD